MWQKSLGSELIESSSEKSEFFQFDPVAIKQPNNPLTKDYQSAPIND